MNETKCLNRPLLLQEFLLIPRPRPFRYRKNTPEPRIRSLWDRDTLAPGHLGPGARLRRFRQVANEPRIRSLRDPDTLAPGHLGPGARLRRFRQVANILAESNHSRAVQHGSLFPKMKRKSKFSNRTDIFKKKKSKF